MAGREHMVRPDSTTQSLTDLTISKVRNEIAVLKRVSVGHRNILTLVDYFETMNNRTGPTQAQTSSSDPLQSTL
jgi:hypothetical protein